MKILLTGSEGFIGQHLKSFLQDKHQLICLDKKTGNDLLNCDLDYDVDLVIHLAGLSGVRDSLDNPVDYWTNNVVATYRIFNQYKNGIFWRTFPVDLCGDLHPTENQNTLGCFCWSFSRGHSLYAGMGLGNRRIWSRAWHAFYVTVLLAIPTFLGHRMAIRRGLSKGWISDVAFGETRPSHCFSNSILHPLDYFDFAIALHALYRKPTTDGTWCFGNLYGGAGTLVFCFAPDATENQCCRTHTYPSEYHVHHPSTDNLYS